MSRRYQAGFVRPGYDPLKVPDAPTIGTATDNATDGSVNVAFTAPSCVGGSAITSYTAIANCGAKFASASSSPITVTGLTNCTSYTFKVFANNNYGPSLSSASSNSVKPTKLPVGQQAYTSSGTYSWVAPAGVTSVSVVAVGGGARPNSSGNGGGGGGLGWKNNITVTPGSSYTVVVGAGGTSNGQAGGTSYFCSTATVRGIGGAISQGGGYTGTGGGNGGNGGNNGAGGGAGGYSGNGGTTVNCAGTAGSGGGGGGAAGRTTEFCPCIGNIYWAAGGGGGVGILGQGSNGTGGLSGSIPPVGGGGGSGGAKGSQGGGACVLGCTANGGAGGAYGGGGGTPNPGPYCSSTKSGNGGGGAVRIIWPGNTRQFPSTCTGDK